MTILNSKHTKKTQKLLRQISKFDLITLALLAMLTFFIWVFFLRQQRNIDIRVKVVDPSVKAESGAPKTAFADAFQVGDEEKNELGETTAKIKNVFTYRLDPERQVVFLDLEINAVFNPRKNIYFYKGRPITSGEPFNFVFSKVSFKSNIVNFPGYKQHTKEQKRIRTVKAQIIYSQRGLSEIYGILPYLVKTLQQGQEIKDHSGKTLVKIIKVTDKPSNRLAVNSSGLAVLGDDPLLRDVFLVLEIATTEVNGKEYMFEDIPFFIGASVPLNFKHTSLFPTIIEIID